MAVSFTALPGMKSIQRQYFLVHIFGINLSLVTSALFPACSTRGEKIFEVFSYHIFGYIAWEHIH